MNVVTIENDPCVKRPQMEPAYKNDYGKSYNRIVGFIKISYAEFSCNKPLKLYISLVSSHVLFLLSGLGSSVNYL